MSYSWISVEFNLPIYHLGWKLLKSFLEISNKDIYFAVKPILKQNEDIELYNKFEDSLFELNNSLSFIQQRINSFHEQDAESIININSLFDKYFETIDLLIHEEDNKEKYSLFVKGSYAELFLSDLAKIQVNPKEENELFFYLHAYVKAVITASKEGVTIDDGRILHGYIVPLQQALLYRENSISNFIDQTKQYTESLKEYKNNLQKFNNIFNKKHINT